MSVCLSVVECKRRETQKVAAGDVTGTVTTGSPDMNGLSLSLCVSLHSPRQGLQMLARVPLSARPPHFHDAGSESAVAALYDPTLRPPRGSRLQNLAVEAY